MRTIILAMAVCAVCLRASAQIEIYQTGTWADIRVAAQDSHGWIHTAGVADPGAWTWEKNWEPSFGHSAWEAYYSGDTRTGIPATMDPAGDGTVISLWTRKTDASVYLVSQNGRGSFTRRGGNIQGPVALARALVDSHTNLWVTERGVNIYKAGSLVHTITLGELWPGGNASDCLPVSMAEDARGRIWFWTSFFSGDDTRGAIRGAIHGVLIAENGAVTNRPALEGVPDGRISVIAPMEGASLWLAVRDAGIFAVNLDILAGAPVAEPESNAFRVVQNIFSVGQDRYVISGSQTEFNGGGLISALWRWRGGHWTKMIDGLDADASLEQLAGRHWCVTTEGLWLGAFGMGGWFVPLKDGPARAINWRINSPFDTINRWCELEDGRMLGLQFGCGGLIAATPLLTESQVRPASASVLHTARPLLQTDDGRVFGVLRGKPGMLCEWEGRSWHEYPLPKDIQPESEYTIMLDSLNRIWWQHIDNNSWVPAPCVIFDPAQKRFEKYSSYSLALQAQLPRLPGLRLGNNEYFAPKFSTDGRICYEDAFGRLYYFNGRVWHEWEKTKISNLQPWYMASGNPFFATDGSLSVTVNNTTWSFSELEGWRTNAVARPLEENKSVPGRNSCSFTPPAGAGVNSSVADRLGTYWLTAGGQLFRSAFGFTREYFPANEPEPFADGRKLIQALVDNFGNAFLRTSVQGRDEYVLVPARGPLPHTTAKLVENGDEGVVLQLAADIPSPRFSWRVDGSPWTQAATNERVSVKDIPEGHHRVQIMALDENLQTGPAPVEVSFDTRAISAQRLQELIAQLGDNDFARREAAVRGLARQAKAALPALREMRESESDPDRRWWLDAAIQECSH
jgi:hypothetical protein